MKKSRVSVGRIGHIHHGKTKVAIAVLYALAGFSKPMPLPVKTSHVEKI